MASAAPYHYKSIDYPGATGTEVSGINNAGQMVGLYYAYPGAPERGFLLSGGAFTAIDYPGAFATIPKGISNTGQIVGQYYTCSSGYGCYYPFVYSAGTFTALPDAPGSMPGTTNPFAINASGQIAGWYVDSCFCTTHGFLYTAGVYTTIDQPGFFQTSLSGLNDSGQIGGASGQCWGCSQGAGFTYQAGVFSQVAPPVSGDITPWIGINNAGDIVGTYYAGATPHAFLLSRAVYTLLDYPGAQWTVAEGQVINSARQVAGIYLDAIGVLHGFIATPACAVCP